MYYVHSGLSAVAAEMRYCTLCKQQLSEAATPILHAVAANASVRAAMCLFVDRSCSPCPEETRGQESLCGLPSEPRLACSPEHPVTVSQPVLFANTDQTKSVDLHLQQSTSKSTHHGRTRTRALADADALSLDGTLKESESSGCGGCSCGRRQQAGQVSGHDQLDARVGARRASRGTWRI